MATELEDVERELKEAEEQLRGSDLDEITRRRIEKELASLRERIERLRQPPSLR
jgi:hypothetical protein